MAYDRFPETSWTLLSKACRRCEEGNRAREDFAQRYYRPVYGYLLALVRDDDKAKDLAQEFFARISESGGLLEHANRDKGGFRNYLRTALRNLVIDHQRRDGKQALRSSWDQESDSSSWQVEGTSAAAESAFHQEWVQLTLEDALTRVRYLCGKKKQDLHLQLFEARYLSEADSSPSWEELGRKHGIDQKTARERSDTVARHFRIVLRRMLRNDVRIREGASVSDDAIDDEIRTLLSPLDE